MDSLYTEYHEATGLLPIMIFLVFKLKYHVQEAQRIKIFTELNNNESCSIVFNYLPKASFWKF